VLRSVSQPLVGLPSQSPKPGLHRRIPQTPAAQLPVALAGAQVRPHPPQCAALVAVLVSQPSPRLALQSPKPGVQTPPQAPPTHDADAFAGVGQRLPQAPQFAASVARFTHALLQFVVGEAQTVVHRPALQTVPRPHAAPQAPQWAVLVARSTSQPLAALASQSPKPALQRAIPHVPAAQLGVALAVTQARPHAPHAATVVFRSTSHPLVGAPSQSPKPTPQRVTAQLPMAQDEVAFARAQTRPHAPQLDGVIARLVSQPLAALPSQSPKPGLHRATAQVPTLQLAVALAREHARPQAPQLVTLVSVLVSQPLAALPSQSPKPRPQVISQRPAAQRGVPFWLEQSAPHAPQCATLDASATSQPLAALPSQSPKPALHEATRHAPAAQAPTPLAGAQARLHAPQCVDELAVFTSQPLAALPSQSAKPAAHDATTHRPPAQALVALARAQRVPQAPQLAALVLSEVSQPLAALPSQSPKPDSQV
jgi:hypothetical protein